MREQVLSIVSVLRGEAAALEIAEVADSLPAHQRDGFFSLLFGDLQESSTEGRLVLPRAREVCTAPPRAVSPREFLLNPSYLGLKDQAFPLVVEHFEEINSGKYEEAVLTGAIGTAKTTLALWTTAYQLYLLSLMTSPQKVFGLEVSSEILVVFQSITGKLAKAVDFDRFRSMLASSHYFTRHFMFDKAYLSEMRFPNRILVKAVSGSETAAIGQNVIGGVIDEVNYMARVEESKQSIDGGSYDQAIALYNSISRRRKSRFMRGGKLPGMLCLVSSKRYPGQFTDVKEEESRREMTETGRTSIYIYDKRTWEVLPPERFSGTWFRVFVGDMSRPPRILEEGDEVGDGDLDLVMDVPETEYRRDFERDIYNALREICGVSTMAKRPFFTRVDLVAQCFGKVKNLVDWDEADFVQRKVSIIPSRIVSPELPRYVHIDSSLSGDSTGIAIGTVTGFVDMDRGTSLVETLPKIRFDLLLRINPPRNGEIEFEKVRKLLYMLIDAGMNIRWVSYDSYQSADSLQILRHNHMITGKLSVDTSTDPYVFLRTAMYDGRVSAPKHDIAQREILSLELVEAKAKLDHPARGSKDVSDAMAAVAFGLTMQRSLWAHYGIPPSRIPKSLVTNRSFAAAEGQQEEPIGRRTRT